MSRSFVIPETFFKGLAEKEKLYRQIWIYWLCEFVDEIFEPDFIEKQQVALPKVREIKDVYNFGIQLLQQEFKIIETKGKKVKQNKPVTKEKKAIAIKVLDYLNSKMGTSYSIQGGNNLKLISERIDEGYVLSDFYTVIDKKCQDWRGSDWEKFLRPITLFSKSKFENYLNGNQETTRNSFDKFADSVNQAKQYFKLRSKQ